MLIRKGLVVAGLLALLAAPGGLQAKTVAWYRFEGLKGPVTEGMVFTNVVNPAKFPMYAGVCDYNGNGKYSKSTLKYTAEEMPWMTNGFETVDLVDPSDATKALPNKGSVAVNVRDPDFRGSPHAQLFIDDDPDLRLQTFTIEFFARSPDLLTGWRCMMCRCGGKYAESREAFRIYVNLLGSGAAYVAGVNYVTVEDPLYDQTGLVTNQVVRNLGSTSNARGFDDNKWHHFALVVDGTAKTVKFYFDYEQCGSTGTYTGDLNYEPGYPLCFGGHPQCTYFDYDASYDEIRISDTALTTAEMLHFKRPAPTTHIATDPRTLLYFPFEGSMTPVSSADEMGGTAVTYTPFYRNHAVNSPFANIDAKPRTNNSVSPAVPQRAAETPGAKLREGLNGSAELTSESCARITTNGVDGCGYAQPIVVHTSDNVQQDLFGDSCTFEAFFKAPYDNFMAQPNNTQMFTLCNAFAIEVNAQNNWLYSRLHGTFGGVNTLGDNKNQTTGKMDGKWHHVAFVYDKTRQHGDLYVDYKWQQGLEKANFNPQPHGTYVNDLLLGGSYWGERWFADLEFDEVRVTRGALKPYEFLTTLPVAAEDADLPARATFDATMEVGPYTNFYAVAAKSGSVAQSTRRAGSVIKVRVGETLVNSNNTGSLSFAGGTVTYAERDVLAAEEQFTVEMFLKTAGAAAGTGIARINRGGFENVTNSATRALGVMSTVTWALTFADADGHLKVKVDTDEAEGQELTFGGASFADDRWHHVGLVFAYDETTPANTAVSLYRDGVLVGTQIAAGHILTRPYRTNLMLGAGEVDAPGFTGFIDELRISSAVLDPDHFMEVQRRGFAVIFR